MTGLRVLYVEDNPDLREAIGLLLEADGREIVTCADGEQALALSDARRFDVVITDVSLPGISGTELARALVARDPQQWVVLCSGYVFGDEVAALGSHVRSLAKPFELEDLESLMDEIGRDLPRGRA